LRSMERSMSQFAPSRYSPLTKHPYFGFSATCTGSVNLVTCRGGAGDEVEQGKSESAR
jgi:hypothetical protein